MIIIGYQHGSKAHKKLFNVLPAYGVGRASVVDPQITKANDTISAHSQLHIVLYGVL